MKVIVSFLLVGLASMVPAFAQQAAPAAQEPVTLNLDRLYMEIDKSPSGLRAYRDSVAESHKLIEDAGIGVVLSTITFEKPLLWETVVALMDDFSLRPRLMYAFFEEADGRIGTATADLASRSREKVGLVLDELAIEHRFLGVVSVVGMVPAKQLRALQGDVRVFLVDTTADENFAANSGNRAFMHHLAWGLYHNGPD